MMDLDGDAIVRLLVAVVLGALIGTEREASDQPAGFRTHIAVCAGAALFGVISTLGFDEFFARRETTNVQVDVTRVASQVVVGIGFLGAGMIFRQGAAVKNLTTAASLWATAAVGLAVGVGDLATGAVATLVLLGSLLLLRPVRAWIRRDLRRDSADIKVELEEGVEPEGVIDALNGLDGVAVHRLVIEKVDRRYVVLAHLIGDRHVHVKQAMEPVTRRTDVITAMDQPDPTPG
jgi:putative Mg2+ transporter-C (MgtC) family protein